MPGLVDLWLRVALIEEAKRGVRFPRLVYQNIHFKYLNVLMLFFT